ncbi:MAG TPA: condensation domain-containing protein, partial [Chitinophagaceae bacterium]|nr:condensation domain-containing protein [Chitinophagaceae bacterium]
IEQLLLPVDYTHPAEKTSFDVISKDINATVTLQLRETAAKQNTTLFVLLLSAFKLLLANYTAQDDIISLVGFDNNLLPENNNAFDGIIYLPVRIVVDGDASFARLLATVNEATKLAKQNAGTSYKLLIEEILPGDKNKQADLFKAIFLMLPQKNNREPAKEPGDPPVKTDVTLRIIEKQDGLWLHIDYCTQLFTANTISRMMVHYIEILFSIAVNEQQSTGTINMLAEEEKHRLLNFYNNTVKYPKEKTVIDLFTGYAKKFPGDTALVFENKTLT